MRFCELRPYVRFARTYRPAQHYFARTSIAQDGRLFYVEDGELTVHVKGSMHAVMRANDGLLLPPGTPYILAAANDQYPLLSIVNFDLTWENAQQTRPMRLLSEGDACQIHRFPSVDDFTSLNQPMFLPGIHSPNIKSLLHDMGTEYAERRLFYESRLSALMTSVLVIMMRTSLNGQTQHPHAIDDMISFIQSNYMRPLPNAEVSRFVNYHPNYANQLMLLHTGQTIRQYIIMCRMNRALELLMTTDLSITEIAEQSGFSGLSQFTREFTARIGCSPSKYHIRKEKSVDRKRL